jgi:methanogenic corrinoid protein MtbC1
MMLDLDDRLDRIYENILDYEAKQVAELVKSEVEAGTDLKIILDDALIAAMDEVGDLFAEGVTLCSRNADGGKCDEGGNGNSASSPF